MDFLNFLFLVIDMFDHTMNDRKVDLFVNFLYVRFDYFDEYLSLLCSELKSFCLYLKIFLFCLRLKFIHF